MHVEYRLFVPGKNAKVPAEASDFVKNWLQELPTVDSHYCRNSDTYKDKKFLQSGATIAQLHREYKNTAEAAGILAVGITFFTELFHEGKYSAFIPRKD